MGSFCADPDETWVRYKLVGGANKSWDISRDTWVAPFSLFQMTISSWQLLKFIKVQENRPQSLLPPLCIYAWQACLLQSFQSFWLYSHIIIWYMRVFLTLAPKPARNISCHPLLCCVLSIYHGYDWVGGQSLLTIHGYGHLHKKSSLDFQDFKHTCCHNRFKLSGVHPHNWTSTFKPSPVHSSVGFLYKLF